MSYQSYMDRLPSFLILSAAVYIFIGFHCGGAFCQQKLADFDEKFFTPSAEIITSHIKWAKPYYKNKIKVLIICPRMVMREVVELSQRLSLEYSTAFIESSNSIGLKRPVPLHQQIKGRLEEDVLKYLYEKLEGSCNYDLMIFCIAKNPIGVIFIYAERICIDKNLHIIINTTG